MGRCVAWPLARQREYGPAFQVALSVVASAQCVPLPRLSSIDARSSPPGSEWKRAPLPCGKRIMDQRGSFVGGIGNI